MIPTHLYHIYPGVKAALLAVGVTASAAHAHIPAPDAHAPTRITLHAAKHHAPATTKAILIQIDHRLGVIKRAQQMMLRGYETGGIYR